MDEVLVGTAEAAAILGVSKQRVGQLSKTPGFPQPLVVLRATPVWRADEIEAYERARRDRPDVQRLARRIDTTALLAKLSAIDAVVRYATTGEPTPDLDVLRAAKDPLVTPAGRLEAQKWARAFAESRSLLGTFRTAYLSGATVDTDDVGSVEAAADRMLNALIQRLLSGEMTAPAPAPPSPSTNSPQPATEEPS